MRHNVALQNIHLRKHWQLRTRTFFNQAAKKRSRLYKRAEKADRLAPRPLEKLRPQVRSQTIRYNRKLRLGRGFTLAELKAAGLGQQFAQSIGISVDHRRKNRCQESIDANKKRLLAYIKKLVLVPRRKDAKSQQYLPKKGLVNDATGLSSKDKIEQNHNVPEVQQPSKREKAVKVSELKQLQKTSVYRTLRLEWSKKRNFGQREKKRLEKEKEV